MSQTEGKGKFSALVVGATGQIGRNVVIQLLMDENWSTVATVTRRNYDYKSLMVDEDFYGVSETDADAALKKLTEHVVDYEDLEGIAKKEEIFHNHDAMFSAMGTTIKTAGSQDAQWNVDVTIPAKLAEAAKEAGVKQIHLVSSMGADSSSGNFYSRMKGEMEEMMQKLEFEQCSVYQPSLLLTPPREDARAGESIAQWMAPAFNALMFGGMKKYRAIKVEDVATAMVFEATRVAMDNQVTGNLATVVEALKDVERYDNGAQVIHQSDVIQTICDSVADAEVEQ